MSAVKGDKSETELAEAKMCTAWRIELKQQLADARFDRDYHYHILTLGPVGASIPNSYYESADGRRGSIIPAFEMTEEMQVELKIQIRQIETMISQWEPYENQVDSFLIESLWSHLKAKVQHVGLNESEARIAIRDILPPGLNEYTVIMPLDVRQMIFERVFETVQKMEDIKYKAIVPPNECQHCVDAEKYSVGGNACDAYYGLISFYF